MNEFWVDLATDDGEMNTFVTHPEEGGPHPVVLFYMDAYGQREELYDMARRIGTAGYFVVLPNLYYRSARQFEAVHGDEDSIKEMGKMMFGVGNRMITRDTNALFELVDGNDAADGGKIGCVGYCMSGPFVFTVAAAYSDRIRCAASVYGAALLTDRHDSPHLGAGDIKGEMYFACAEIDEWASPDLIGRLEAHLRDAGTNYRIDWYPGAKHGFAFPGRTGVYDKPSAERHWERLFDLFKRNLT